MFYENKNHKSLFISTKSYAQDFVYKHKMSTKFDAHRCCLSAQMNINKNR